MRGLGILIFCLFSLPVFAKNDGAKKSDCSVDLDFRISKGAYQDQERHNLSKPLMDAVVEDALKTLKAKYECSPEYVIVFRKFWPTSDRENAGYIVTFSEDKHDRIWLERIEPALIPEQRDYFEKLAECEKVPPIAMMLSERLLDQRSITIPGSVQVKFREKHQLPMQAVREALVNRLGPPQFVPSRKKQLNDRYQFKGVTKSGRELKIVVDVNPADKSVSLVSAY